MKRGIIVEGNTAFLPQSGATVFMQESGPSAPGALPTRVGIKNDLNNATPWAPWGDDNLMPNEIIDKMSKCGVGKRGLRFNSKAHYGRGLSFAKKEFGKGMKLLPVDPAGYPEAAAFFKKNKIKRYLREAIQDFEWFQIAFPEMIVSNDYSKIVSIRHLEAANGRWELMNKDSGRIEHAYFSPDWEFEAGQVQKVPVIDPWLPADEVREFLKKKRVKKFIYPTFYPTPGRDYYPDADWHTVVRNGWVELANAIPLFKKALMENQLSIKYHIKIPADYWVAKYPKWKDYSDAEREDKRAETLTQFDDFLKGAKNAGKAFLSEFAVDPISKKPLPGWEITVIDDKFKEGAYIEDGQAASTEILFAIGVDLSLIGAGFPGGKLGAGSGSDKREAFNIYIALKQADRDTVIEPFEFIKEYNSWPEELEFMFMDWELTTTDQAKSGIVPAINE